MEVEEPESWEELGDIEPSEPWLHPMPHFPGGKSRRLYQGSINHYYPLIEFEKALFLGDLGMDSHCWCSFVFVCGGVAGVVERCLWKSFMKVRRG